ncbi:glycosyltransferase family 1 protein [Pseudomonas sp. A-1]|jgi:glycosyltransferase involved in cell wall biosynthesis|uniref:glycosyltransferase family 4 protein n=1 Tax=unclassified Pseudomonas TaxID=196821 RepID=UPI0010A5EF53|nr:MULTISPECIES: glycosyltransferase family 1 protein [unclassified Pseudomonas]THG86079.1 glycosyltransferase family 1 protein [Pseudomonas sp. A-1]WPP45928.1 glycosyltransferase family 1 protein [Pseudomonas sp. AN-1]
MRLLIVSDTWEPRVSGVVTCLRALVMELEELGCEVGVLSPLDFRSLPCPGYPEIALAWDIWRVAARIEAFAPDAVHLATEGPLGWAARHWLQRRGLAFSTAMHTRFPEFVHARWPVIPLSLGYAWMRAFHRPSDAVLVSTVRMQAEFARQGFAHLGLWRKGVDIRQFQPRLEPDEGAPVFLYVGRLAPEKTLEAFLDLELPGEKRVVGDGPLRGELQRRYPQVRFLGYLRGETLAEAYRSASVLVFPSRTDTLGLVMLEALACGTPVAAFPVSGPLDVLRQGVSGVMDEDLQRACLQALELDRRACAEEARRQSWQASALEFLARQPRLDGAPCLPAERLSAERAAP